MVDIDKLKIKIERLDEMTEQLLHLVIKVKEEANVINAKYSDLDKKEYEQMIEKINDRLDEINEIFKEQW